MVGGFSLITILILEIFGIILLADFISGIGHWWEDAYGNPNWTWFGIGKHIVQPNLEHHQKPRKFLNQGYYSRNNSTFAVVGIAAVIFFLCSILTWQSTLLLVILSQINEVHAMAHRSPKEKWEIISYFQSIGLLQSSKQHGEHHISPYDINYCILTDYLNPLLNKINFWQNIEKAIKFFTGISPLRGSKIRKGL